MTNQLPPAAAQPRRRLAAGMTWRRWLIDLLLIAGGIVSVIFEPVSIAMHSVIGLAFAGTVGPHLWYRRSWIAGTVRRLRQRRRLTPRLRCSLGQSLLLAATTAVVTVTGLWDWLGTPTRINVHGIASIVLIAVAARHAWTRRGWLTRRRVGSGASDHHETVPVGVADGQHGRHLTAHTQDLRIGVDAARPAGPRGQPQRPE